MSGRIPYQSMGEPENGDLLPRNLRSIHAVLKAMGQLQTLLGLVCLALGSLADYVSWTWSGGLRVRGVPEICGLYFLLTGLLGICGSASFRRGLMVAFLVMSLHASLFFVPLMVLSSILGILLTNRDCWLKVDWTDSSSYGIFCGEFAREQLHKYPNSMSHIAVDSRIEWGLVGVGGVEVILSVITVIFACKAICECCGLVDRNVLQQIVFLTSRRKKHSELNRDPEIATISNSRVTAEIS